MLGSWYICEVTLWNPMAGPPERISTFTPVSTPDAISGPDTSFLSALMTGLAPTIW